MVRILWVWERERVLLLFDSLDNLIDPVCHECAHTVDVIRWAEASDREVPLLCTIRYLLPE